MNSSQPTRSLNLRPVFALICLAVLTLASAALAGPPICGDGTCNGCETCDGTNFCRSTNCPAGTTPVCDAGCGGYSCQPTGGGDGDGTLDS